MPHEAIGEKMLHILLATTRLESTHPFVRALLEDTQVRLDGAASAAEVLQVVRTSPPHLVIVDHQLPDAESLGLVSKILTVNAMVNSAVVSPLSEQEFHEASEGLGVLACLPVEPGTSDATRLLKGLRKILGVGSTIV